MRTFSNQEKRILRKIISLNKRGAKIISLIPFSENLLNLRSQLYVIKGKDTSHLSKEEFYPFCKIEIYGKAADVYKDYFALTQRLLYVTEFIDYLLKEKYLVVREPNILSSFYFNKIEYLSKELNGEDSGAVKIDLKITSEIKTFLEKCSYYYTPTNALIQLIKNNFRTGNGNNLWISKISLGSLFDYLLFISSDWGNYTYQRTSHRAVNVRPHKSIYHTNESSIHNTDLVYMSMLED
ncbi:hypothetical protein [Sporocytophaga myxococcoides]|uniref:hypothetical protein n=1 Tax=Sporocytophaga myxococcoides TaxID=153721 RepID=UPI00040ED32D|nr:hypothetical protein [Sporocytophaga myxococcoides]